MAKPEKWEKVIKGLEHCVLDDDGYPNCFGCPYGIPSIRCNGDLVEDALALLKAQEQKIESLKQEIEAYKDDLQETLDVMVGYANKLKVQESRVVTLEEAQTALHNDDVVWVELKGKIICAGIRMDGTDYFTMQNGDVLDVTDFDNGEGAEMYGKEVRCWTSRPDEERMEATPWN